MDQQTLALTPAIAAARSQWRYRGDTRPPFAEEAVAGELSVWDFPRPPRLEPVADELSVFYQETELARTVRGMRVLETAGAPTYYFPPEDVQEALLRELNQPSLCEWKGVATSFALQEGPNGRAVAWCYRQTFPEFLAIRGWYAFYPIRLACFVGCERVAPQPGGYYGGWVTGDLRGPIKGDPGTGSW
jgi:uncharacterized protein (DUF427 family)